jgi:hypothetical protein
MADFLHVSAAKSSLPRVRTGPKSAALPRTAAMTGKFLLHCALIALAIPASPAAVRAQPETIFKCVDSEGGIAFQAVPCKPGLRESQVAINPAPAVSASPDYARPRQRKAAAPKSSASASRQTIVYSFECRSRSGLLFYRHDHCPASIDRSGLIGGRRGASRETVSGRRIPRLQACRGMRSARRDGREFDNVPTTYERNLGRDPCRRY